jgi:uncharacterized repeat protein (TIGR04076 family)
MMADRYKVKVTVHTVPKDKCSQGFKVGDHWIIQDGKTPSGMCASAYNTIYPSIRVFRYGGQYPSSKDKDVHYISCPDPERGLIYEIKRLRV